MSWLSFIFDILNPFEKYKGRLALDSVLFSRMIKKIASIPELERDIKSKTKTVEKLKSKIEGFNKQIQNPGKKASKKQIKNFKKQIKKLGTEVYELTSQLNSTLKKESKEFEKVIKALEDIIIDNRTVIQREGEDIDYVIKKVKALKIPNAPPQVVLQFKHLTVNKLNQLKHQIKSLLNSLFLNAKYIERGVMSTQAIDDISLQATIPKSKRIKREIIELGVVQKKADKLIGHIKKKNLQQFVENIKKLIELWETELQDIKKIAHNTNILMSRYKGKLLKLPARTKAHKELESSLRKLTAQARRQYMHFKVQEHIKLREKVLQKIEKVPHQKKSAQKKVA